MKRSRILITFLLLSLWSCTSDFDVIYTGPWVFKSIDDTEWFSQFPKEEGQYWLKTDIQFDKPLKKSTPYGLTVSLLASSEVYWDGILIGVNGIVGKDANSEIPGQYNKVFLVPDSLLNVGKHEVKVRLSNFHVNGNPRFYTIFLAEYWASARYSLIETSFVHIYAGFFLIIGLYFLVRFFLSPGQIANLLFGLISLAFFGLLLVEYMKFYYFYSYPWHFTRLRIILGITTFISVLLPTYFGFQFKLSRGKIQFILSILLFSYLLALYLLQFGYDFATQATMALGITASCYIAFQSYKNKVKGSTLALIGLAPIVFSYWLWIPHYDYVIFIGFGHLILMNLISIAVQEKDQRKSKEKAMLLSSRLETELLKKSIQPHFLMNSLTSAIDWMEENPRTGVDLLYALAKESDLILDISGEKLIPIEQEIELCQTHAEIMSFRKEKAYVLNTYGIKQEEMIPPAVLHTVIENGITHNNLDKNEICFEITFEETSRFKEYYIFVENNSTSINSVLVEGTGIKYIKARLEESYPGNWEFNTNSVNGGWETRIRILR